MKEHSFYWLEHFKGHPEFGKYRFKRLDKGFNGFPLFYFDESLLDVVDLES